MLENPLCSFWSHGLSEVWAGTEVEPPKPQTAKRGQEVELPLLTSITPEDLASKMGFWGH